MYTLRNCLFSSGSYINPFFPLLDIILWPFGKSTVDNGNRLRIIIRGLAEGAKATLFLSVISVFGGFFIALVISMILVNKGHLFGLKFLAQLYVDFFRSTPLLVQILIFYFGLPEIFPNFTDLGASQEFITATILDGRPGTAMPAWRPLLTPAEAEWLTMVLLEGNLP